MVKDNIKANENIKPNSRELEVLRANFPQFFNSAGEFAIDRFSEMLKTNEVRLYKEGYGLNFLGKSYAKYLSCTKTETFIAPHIQENSKEENKESENIYIIGDNLDALKHLLGSYSSKIKCIYIDPPYNTGSDGFLYPDNFSFSATELSSKIGIEEEEAERIIGLKGKSSHSAWLTFMYPRLILARDLLSNDGVIFISIDDNEQANLKLVCDEIFGEENCVLQISWRRTDNQPNIGNTARVKEYVLVYCKNKDGLKLARLPLSESALKEYRYKDTDNKKFRRGILLDKTRGRYSYSIKTKSGKILNGPWMVSEDKFNQLEKEDKIYWPKGGEEQPYTKIYLKDNKGAIPNDFWGIDFGTNQRGSLEVEELFGNRVFDFPKPMSLLKNIIQIGTDSDSLILDFFSGSASTAEAVMRLNAEDGGRRKFIMVQIAEKVDEKKTAYKAGYKTIDEIGRERIKRAFLKIKQEKDKSIDGGFKTYSLKELEEDVLTRLEFFCEDASLALDDMVGIFDTNIAKGKDAILTTYAVLDGYGLSAIPQSYKLDNFVADKIGNSLYIIDDGLKSSDVMELIRRIEDLSLDVSRVVVYAHSINFTVGQELKQNLIHLRNKHVELVERY